MLRVFGHFIGAIFAMFLGMVAWVAPHIEWSGVKDDSLLSIRGCVVLGMTLWVFCVNLFAALEYRHGKKSGKRKRKS